MKTTKKLGLAVLTTAMMVTGASGLASAQEYQTAVPINAPINAPVNGVYSLTVNGSAVSGAGYMNKNGKDVMIPLRDLAAALGYNVTWNGKTQSVELMKGAQWTSVKLGADQYSFARMLIKLGAAPEQKNGKIFVPDSFAAQVLQADVARVGGTVEVTLAEKKTMTTDGFVTGVNVKDGEGSVRINGTGTEGLVLNVGKETVVKAEDGTVLQWTDVQLGYEVEAVHSLAQTMSLPPQTALYELIVKKPAAAIETLGTAGAIEEVTKAEDGTVAVRIKGEALSDVSQSEIKLMLSENTQLVTLTGEKATADQLVKGARIIGFYGPMMTKSLPPIGTAWKLVVLPAAQ
ncbi:copper amine oxidase N-terminal domain-containing protein [Paenibacillus methanolicus]|uniref:Copper amine oxidase-like protein n=1 Tax=Paenibacillus methanolicus TaxID=582686 RepID=A0A5S5C7F5_9BACL|nr:copper amine oxidase N-terminal domain-containing protein [Paenibacillus methanolicus]TYP73913.1 copper amine oxidase-like protein [Paenibacillus methanolicus]